MAEPDEATYKPMESSIVVERSFRIDGKKVTVRVVFPATLGKEIGLERAYEAARRVQVEVDGKQSQVVPLKLGES